MRLRTVIFLLALYVALVTARAPHSGRGVVWDWGGVDLAYSPGVFLCRPYSALAPTLEVDC